MKKINLFFNLGRYFVFMKQVFSRPEKLKIFFKQFLFEIDKLGIGSLGIVVIISIFMGAVVTVQNIKPRGWTHVRGGTVSVTMKADAHHVDGCWIIY